MDLKLIRTTLTDQSTIGDLFVNGRFECHTLEDMVRPVKIKGMTAIPAGTYEIIINFSQRFQKQLPRLLNVPNFDGVLIHAGNTAADTEGCLLVGQTKSRDMIGSSRAAFAALFAKLQAATAVEKIFIEIVNPGDAASGGTRGASRGASRGTGASAGGSVRRSITAGPPAAGTEPADKPVVKKVGSRSTRGAQPAGAAEPASKPVVKKAGTRSAAEPAAAEPASKPVVKKTGTRGGSR